MKFHLGRIPLFNSAKHSGIVIDKKGIYMHKKYLSHDIYDRRGRLLLAKGEKLSEDLIKKLDEYECVQTDQKLTGQENLCYEQNVKNQTDQIRMRLKIDNTQLINSASEIVTGILFKSKNKPWWMYINALSNYVDWLYTHSIDVSVIAVMIAESLSINCSIDEIALGALLHDVGKLMIPKNILQKPSSLSDEEFVYMRQHCDLGISMMKDFHLPQISLDIIQQHHERLDGSGYPQGLTGLQIPIHSRIVMIADILDAITSYRPYKSLRQIESAVNELKANPAKYPQEILDAFSSLFTAKI